jgi:hypothetical protein
MTYTIECRRQRSFTRPQQPVGTFSRGIVLRALDAKTEVPGAFAEFHIIPVGRES